jgi:hypothetical protein
MSHHQLHQLNSIEPHCLIMINSHSLDFLPSLLSLYHHHRVATATCPVVTVASVVYQPTSGIEMGDSWPFGFDAKLDSIINRPVDIRCHQMIAINHYDIRSGMHSNSNGNDMASSDIIGLWFRIEIADHLESKIVRFNVATQTWEHSSLISTNVIPMQQCNIASIWSPATNEWIFGYATASASAGAKEAQY